MKAHEDGVMVRYRCICASADNTCTSSSSSSSSFSSSSFSSSSFSSSSFSSSFSSSSSSSFSSASRTPSGTLLSALAVLASSASRPLVRLVLRAVFGKDGVEDECAEEQYEEEEHGQDEEQVWLLPVSQLSLELPNSMFPTTARASATALTVAGADDAGRMDSCRRKSSGITKNSPQQSAQKTYRHMRQWCLRRNVVKVQPHNLQVGHAASGIQHPSSGEARGSPPIKDSK